MTNVAAAPIRVRMSRILEAALVYVYVSPPEITSTDPINVSCQSIAITSPRILLASHAKVYRRGRRPCSPPGPEPRAGGGAAPGGGPALPPRGSGLPGLEPSSHGGALGGTRTPKPSDP